MRTTEWFLIDGINPEPWTAPEVSSGRKNGRIFTQAFKSAGLIAYQEAVKEDLLDNYPDFEKFDGLVSLEIYFWRQLSVYVGDHGRVQRHAADATNMQKALEDAIQGVLITNDRNVMDVRSVVVEELPETEPKIFFKLAEWVGADPFLVKKIDAVRLHRSSKRHPANGDTDRSGVEDLF